MTATPLRKVGSEVAPTPSTIKLPCRFRKTQTHRGLVKEDLSSGQLHPAQSRMPPSGNLRGYATRRPLGGVPPASTRGSQCLWVVITAYQAGVLLTSSQDGVVAIGVLIGQFV